MRICSDQATAKSLEFAQLENAIAKRGAWSMLVAVLATGVANAQVPVQEVVVPQVRQLAIGDVIRDCAVCPPVVVLAPGAFLMGHSPQPWQAPEEEPSHPVTIAHPVAVGMYEVTFREWDACVAEAACPNTDDEGWGRGSRPVVNVDWDDVQDYLKWLSSKTARPYRLPSEAEWEYAARAGTQSLNYWGNWDELSNSPDALCRHAHIGDSRQLRCRMAWPRRTAPVGSLIPNGFGLYDMIGNVAEWTADCWNDNYDDAPADGRPWLQGDCRSRVVRGGSWMNTNRWKLRSAARVPERSGWRGIGFRVARSLISAPSAATQYR